MFRFPIEIWRANLGVVADYIGSYYTWAVALFFGGFSWIAFRKRSFPELTLAGICLAGTFAVTFLLRGFNEYMLNTAVIVALLPLLGRMALLLARPLIHEKEIWCGGQRWPAPDLCWLTGLPRTF